MHSAYQRIVPGADTALLCIHGIIGTPRHFDRFLTLVPENISVYNILLDGHGKGVKEFSAASMKKWEAQVSEAIEFLSKEHNNIYVLAHSMGTLLALDEVAKGNRIQKMFLLAVPLRIHIKGVLLKNLWNVYFNRIDPNDPIGTAARNCCGVTQSRNIFLYLGWIPRYLELFQKIARVQKILPDLQTPCSVYQSRNDELVSLRSVAHLHKLPAASVEILENCYHFYYDSKDFDTLLKDFTAFIQEKGAQ